MGRRYMHAPPITLAVEGKQHVTTASGTKLFTFDLPLAVTHSIAATS